MMWYRLSQQLALDMGESPPAPDFKPRLRKRVPAEGDPWWEGKTRGFHWTPDLAHTNQYGLVSRHEMGKHFNRPPHPLTKGAAENLVPVYNEMSGAEGMMGAISSAKEVTSADSAGAAFSCASGAGRAACEALGLDFRPVEEAAKNALVGREDPRTFGWALQGLELVHSPSYVWHGKLPRGSQPIETLPDKTGWWKAWLQPAGPGWWKNAALRFYQELLNAIAGVSGTKVVKLPSVDPNDYAGFDPGKAGIVEAVMDGPSWRGKGSVADWEGPPGKTWVIGR